MMGGNANRRHHHSYEIDSLASFDVLIDSPSSVAESQVRGCNACFHVGGLMTQLFAFPSEVLQAASPSSTKTDEEPELPTTTLKARRRPSPRQLACRAWKKKRKAEKKALREAAKEAAAKKAWTDHEIQCELKREAMLIQRNYEEHAGNIAVMDESFQDSVFSYERYGTRSHFIRDSRREQMMAASMREVPSH